MENLLFSHIFNQFLLAHCYKIYLDIVLNNDVELQWELPDLNSSSGRFLSTCVIPHASDLRFSARVGASCEPIVWMQTEKLIREPSNTAELKARPKTEIDQISEIENRTFWIAVWKSGVWKTFSRTELNRAEPSRADCSKIAEVHFVLHKVLNTPSYGTTVSYKAKFTSKNTSKFSKLLVRFFSSFLLWRSDNYDYGYFCLRRIQITLPCLWTVTPSIDG